MSIQRGIFGSFLVGMALMVSGAAFAHPRDSSTAAQDASACTGASMQAGAGYRDSALRFGIPPSASTGPVATAEGKRGQTHVTRARFRVAPEGFVRPAEAATGYRGAPARLGYRSVTRTACIPTRGPVITL